MKRHYIIMGFLLALCTVDAKSQIVTGNSMFVQIGTVFSIDSLVLVPTEGLNLGDNYSLDVEYTAVPGNPQASIQKVYVFNKPVNFEGSVGIIYHPSQLNGNTESLLELANSWSDESGFVTMTGSTRDPAQHFVSKDVSGLDIRMMTLVNAQSALPVTLAAFQATKAEDGVRLDWNTTLETNSEYFEIQHSINGKVWHTLGKVAAAGESKLQNNYSFLHDDPQSGDNLYRLKMVDRDKTFAYSQIRQISWNSSGTFAVFPNPASDKLDIRTARKTPMEKLKILDTEGILVKEVNTPHKPVALQGLGAGHYVLQVIYADGTIESRHFVKN